MNFECHITCPREHGAYLEEMAGRPHSWWKYSAIDGDPVLGKKAFCYLTGHGTNYENVLAAMRSMHSFLFNNGVPVVRAKIELIMFDERYDK